MAGSKISVIIPAWNAGEYLERCLLSIQKQTFTAFEVIVVDVESTDNTAAIAQEYARNDERFFYYKYVFSRCGIGRNFGMEKAASPFIAFADADDTLEPDMLETMYSVATTENADIVVCDFNMIYPDKHITSFSQLQDLTIDLSLENFAEYYFRYNAGPKPNNYAWSRLYRSDFIQKTGIRYEDVLTSEDHLFNLMLSCSMPRISHTAKSLYNYIQREDSSVRQTARLTNQGKIYFSVFDIARKFLESVDSDFVSPILSIYAFTRIRSIIFYGQLASLPEDKLQEAITSFLEGEKVEYYLSVCNEKGYIRDYCRINDIHSEHEQLFKDILTLCLKNKTITIDKSWFS
ncbi:glycosyltransferase family 2 protein [Cohnella phaseoli]|uniref:Glycosyltransferase involved in cell wall biosynthesis n=1 Tax=Cohnella phaseoli TaxID=456490 RepID=A0A3D9KEM2_9BACL|nr:glycosyltransferase [Cohnella phaseoli]RED83976.1 glycosyltransferase involved in cell wall biosynthesis [Cohnella phaseoli]